MHMRNTSIYFAVSFLSSTTAVLAAVPPYGQCGGQSHQGETACSEGWTCTKYNDYYSQCVGGNPNGNPGGQQPPATTEAPGGPSGAPQPSPNATTPIETPSESSGIATVPSSTLDTVIVTPSPVAEPVAVSSTTSVLDIASSTGAIVPIPTQGTGGSGKNGAKCSLDAAFKASGKKYFGTATDRNLLTAGQNSQLIIDNFGQVTPENSMKWDATEATQGQLTLQNADYLVDWATTNKKLIRGHTTVWHSQLPTWVSSITDKTKLTEVMSSHITKLMSAYAGKVYAWDVINEIFEENGSFRSSVFYNVLGEDFVKIAFTTARQADPDAKLYINDYNLDSPSYAKTKGFAAAVKKWVAAGVPIDGVGSQSHLSGNWPISDFAAATKLICADVKECAITELDIKGASSADYTTAVKACLDVENCVGVTVWGVSDKDSWRKTTTPLLFDEQSQAKEAYNGLCSLLAV